MEKTTFGKWFSEALSSRGLSQADYIRLAERRGRRMDSAVVSNLINNKRNAGPDTCREIAYVLQIPIDEPLIAADIKPASNNFNPLIEGTVEIMKGMEEDEQKGILEYARLRHNLTVEKKAK